MWWRERDRTLEEQLDSILRAEPNEHLSLFNPPQRENDENYQLGNLLLRRHGIHLTLHPKGPLCLHYAEGLPEDPQKGTEALKEAFQQADEQLRRFWEPLWTLEAKGPLRQHARWLIRREQAINANTAHSTELERVRAENKRLRAEVEALRASLGKAPIPEKPRCS